MDADLKVRIKEDTRAAMRAQEKPRLAVLRLINAEIQQVEVDSRQELNNQELVALLVRMQKQRTASAAQYRQGGRPDLATQEEFEISVIQEFLPPSLSQAEMEDAVREACNRLQVDSMQHMGKVMGFLTQSLAGRADMAQVSEYVRKQLSKN